MSPAPRPAGDRPAPLSGVRVLDLTRVLSGPFATLLLADLGAKIWKVEHPEGGDETRGIEPSLQGQSHYFMAVNRNKASLAIDLKTSGGRDLALRLAEQADVLVENFRPGVMDRLGLGYERLRQGNPGLVYCSVSAFGQTGPDAGRTAFDVAVQAMSGLMHITGEPDGRPVRAGIAVADLVAGLVADIGVVAALFDRQRSGLGRQVDVGMLDAMVGMLTYYAGRFFMTGEEPSRVGSGHMSVVPYGVYGAADGDIVLATLSERYWPELCRVIGRDDLAADPRLSTNAGRVSHRNEVEGQISATLATQTVEHWQEVLTAADIPHAPILSVGQAVDHPQVRHRDMVRPLQHPLLGVIDSLGPMLKFPGSDVPPPEAAPALGEDTVDVLRDVLGLGEDEIEALAEAGVIGPTKQD